MGGIFLDLGRAWYPTYVLLAYWRITLSSLVPVAGWWKRSGLTVYGFSGFPNLRTKFS